MTTIMSILNEVRDQEIVLPAIQRDFVWSEEKVEKLLDSIMRGYPIGIALLWETYEDIQYRPFIRDFVPGNLYSYSDNRAGRKLKLVLDGQQRLQSLYSALFGQRGGRSLYFDVLSGEETDDVAEERFRFEFLTDAEADEWNGWAEQEAARPAEDRDEDFPEFVIKVSDLFGMGPRERRDFARDTVRKLGLDDAGDDAARLDLNLQTLDNMLTKDPNILKVSIIDEDIPPDTPYRKSDADVLEVFFRINREGTPLSRSDLIFSMLKLNWRESAEALPEFVRRINEGNSFSLDTDFVVRSLFAVSDLGTRLDPDLLRKRKNVKALRDNFAECCDSIRAAVDFVQTECKIASSTLLGSANTLVPLVYYLFHTDRHEIANQHVDSVRAGVYLLGFAKPFSRYADSRIAPYLRAELAPRLTNGNGAFPIARTIARIKRWERVASVEDLAQTNAPLTLHLVQGLTGAKIQYAHNYPEVDHIFPRAELRKKGYAEDEINDFGNFWILARGKNRNKSNRHPRHYFADVGKRQLEAAIIDPEMLDYRRYTTFLRGRRDAIIARLESTLGVTEDDLVSPES
jgi:hypothetical protein